MMPQRCQVCTHPQTKEIENDIVNNKAYTSIADSYGLDNQAVRRHAQNHLPKKLIRSMQDQQRKHTRGILSGIEDLLNETETILKEARENGQNRLALDAIKEGRNTYELLSKIAVKLREYQKSEEKKKNHQAESQAKKGLQALSDKELELYIQLQAKIYSADPDYELDGEVRMFVDSVKQIFPSKEHHPDGKHHSVSQEHHDDDNIEFSPRTPLEQANNTKKDDADDLLLDDLNDFDLDGLDNDDDTIPSEETDPPWLVKYRNR